MTVDDLIAEATRNRTDPMEADALSPSSLGELLRIALEQLLEDFDYQANQTSGAAIAARVLAAIISCCDEAAAGLARKNMQ